MGPYVEAKGPTINAPDPLPTPPEPPPRVRHVGDWIQNFRYIECSCGWVSPGTNQYDSWRTHWRRYRQAN